MAQNKYGRWVRVEAQSAGGRARQRVLNLDNVSSFYAGPLGATFVTVDGDVLDTAMPFEDTCMLVMVAEADFIQRELAS